jgi:hypothetical protein
VFDLRYHVASLTAVFVALVVGILVGVGLSGKGFVNDAERSNLNNQIADLRNERDSARASLDQATKGALALKDFSDSAYPAVVPGRLAGQKVAVLYAGPVDRGVSFAVEKAVRDAGGNVVRVRSLEVPIDVKAMEEALKRIPGQKRLQGTEHLDNLGNALAFEFAAGGKTPLWDALGKTMVQERDGSSTPTADALVVVRTAKPQQGPTRTFLTGLYDGLGRAGEPASSRVSRQSTRSTPRPGGSGSSSSCRGPSRGATGSATSRRTASSRRSRPWPRSSEPAAHRPRRRA